jgi:hypothetical protein
MSNHVATQLIEILRQMRTTRFQELSGARINAAVPVAERLLNDLIATSLPSNAPVRSVTIHPLASDRFSVRIVASAPFIPAITLQLAIDAQPRVPEEGVLTLRLVTLGGLFGLASGVITGFLPPHIRLDGERIHLDLRAIATERGAGEIFDYLTSLQVHSDDGRLILHLDAAVPAR